MNENGYAFFDVDRTLRKGSAALDFCMYLADLGIVAAGFKDKDAQVRKQYKAGKLTYEQMVDGVVTIHASVLSGLKEEDLIKYYEGFNTITNAFFEWVEPLFKLLRDRNFTTILVSAGIYPAIAAVGKHLKVDEVFASLPELRDGVYTGKVNNILHDEDKKHLIHKYLNRLPANRFVIGFGDSTGDVSMLKLMDEAMIFDPHQDEMLTIAVDYDWKVFREGKSLIDAVLRTIKK